MGIYSAPTKNFLQTTLDSTLAAGAVSLTTADDLSSYLTGVSTDNPITIVIDRIDSNENATPNKREIITATGVSGKTISGLTRNADSGSSDQEHSSGAVVEFIADALFAASIITTVENEHNADGTHKADSIDAITEIAAALKSGADGTLITGTAGTDGYTGKWNADGDLVDGYEVLDEDDMSSNSATKLATQQSIKAYVDSLVDSDGWVSGDTLVYVSANSVKVEGSDVTTKYKIGTKVKFDNDSTTQYWVVQSVSFSTDTTITFIETDSHTIANSAITNSYYSYQEAPQGWPKYFLYTPTWTGFSSDPTEELEWSVSGRTIFIFIKSGDGTSNSATFDFTLPVSERQDQAQYYSSIVSVKDNGTWQTGAGIVGVSGTTAKVGKTIATQSANAFAGFTTSGAKAVQGQIWYNF